MTFYREKLEKAALRATMEFRRPITIESLRARCKSLHHTKPRWFVMAYLHATGDYSMPQIARALKMADHTTVLYGLRRAHGHDGKPPKRKHEVEPLWNKEHFQNIVDADGFTQAREAA